MTPAVLVVAAPFAGALALTCAPGMRAGAWLNAAVATIVFALAARLPSVVGAAGPWLLVDRLAASVALLTAFVAMTAAWFSVSYMAAEIAAGRFAVRRLRLYHAAFQVLAGGLLLGVLSNDMGSTIAGILIATVAAALLAVLPDTSGTIAVAWKLLLVCGAGALLAGLGTAVLCSAAQASTLTWSALPAAVARADARLLNLGFVLLLIGYGTIAALVPLHAWLADAQVSGPLPASAVLGGSVLNVALLAILRLRLAMDAPGGSAVAPGPPIMALGLLSVLLAGFSLWRQTSVRRFLAFSTIGQSGLAAFAIGLGGPVAILAGLLQLGVHTLANAGAFQIIDAAAQLKASEEFAGIGGLIGTHRALGFTIAAGLVALAALPPFGLFASQFLILSAAVRQSPLLALPLAVGLLAGLWAMMRALHRLCLGAATPDRGPAPGLLMLAPVWLQLALVAWIGFATPGPLTDWMRAMAAGR